MQMNKMKKIILMLVLLVFSTAVLADVPSTNRMKLGSISNVLPTDEMRDYYADMEPVMLKYFGPPFSDYALTIEADPSRDEHSTGFIAEKQALLLAGQARDYVKYKDTDPEFAIENIQSSMRHELSHGMYMYGNDKLNFGMQWPWEGWAKVLEELMIKEIDGRNIRLNWFYEFYMDKDLVAGTKRWGAAKQNTNHHLVYGMTTATHFILLAAASSSNTDLDFYKKMNNALYDYISDNNKPHLELSEYKNILKPLLANVNVDGQDALKWYFSNPAVFTDGSLGEHVGIYLESEQQEFRPYKIIAYVFERSGKGDDKGDIGLTKSVEVAMVNADGEVILSKTIDTKEDGEAEINLWDYKISPGAYLLTAKTDKAESKMFAILPPRIPVNEEYIYGILLDENEEPIKGEYVSLLDVDTKFVYKKNGIFIVKVPVEEREVTLDFLGLKQDVTNGPFARIYAFTIPQEYITKAEGKTQEELQQGIIDVEIKEGFTKKPEKKEKEPDKEEEEKAEDDKEQEEIEQDEEQSEVKEDEPVMKKETFFQKIIDFFQKLFG